MDYGIIHVRFHRGLSLDQKVTIVKLAVENQLLVTNRTHYIDILDKCISIAKIMDDPFEFSFNNYKYIFKFIMEVM